MSIQSVAGALAGATVERDDEIRAILRALIAREHVLLVGPPGTGKSYLCRACALALSANYCERLLSPTTAPEALFGPISISALREDRYEHVTAGTVADSAVVFLDEVFRGSAAVRDTLLHLLGPERQALIGTTQTRVPLVSAIGAANHWDDAADQAAFLDRWLIRREVRPVSPAGRHDLIWSDFPAVAAVSSMADLETAQQEADALPVSPEAQATYADILDSLTAEGIRPSDRRIRAAVKIARAEAVLQGATEVSPAHLEPLADCLWDSPGEQIGNARAVVERIANPTGARVTELLREAEEVLSDSTEPAKRLAALKKLETIEESARKIVAESGGNGRPGKALAYVRSQRVRLQAEALGIDPAKAAALLGGNE